MYYRIQGRAKITNFPCKHAHASLRRHRGVILGFQKGQRCASTKVSSGRSKLTVELMQLQSQDSHASCCAFDLDQIDYTKKGICNLLVQQQRNNIHTRLLSSRYHAKEFIRTVIVRSVKVSSPTQIARELIRTVIVTVQVYNFDDKI